MCRTNLEKTQVPVLSVFAPDPFRIGKEETPHVVHFLPSGNLSSLWKSCRDKVGVAGHSGNQRLFQLSRQVQRFMFYDSGAIGISDPD
jgi:hypothetical protein